MLSWSARRRAEYLGGIIVVLVILAAGLYLWSKPAASCFDGKQNQNERGVDCGGACAKVCPLEVVAPQILWSRVFKVGEGKYDAAALVKNPNLRHGTQPLPYLFKIWDEGGLLLSTRRGTLFLNPGEELLVFESRVEAGLRVPRSAEFTLEQAPVWQKVDRQTPALEVKSKDFENLPTPRLRATLKNNSLAALHGLTVGALLSDEQENAIAVSATYVEDLPAGATADLNFTWPTPLAANVAFIDLFPHFNLTQVP